MPARPQALAQGFQPLPVNLVKRRPHRPPLSSARSNWADVSMTIRSFTGKTSRTRARRTSLN